LGRAVRNSPFPGWRHASEAQFAEEEATEYETGTTVRNVTVAVSTHLFPDLTVRPGSTDIEQILATLWVAGCALELHGVWWQDRYEPESLSAPRGVLTLARIPEWISSATRRE